jgi:hypothetical protein
MIRLRNNIYEDYFIDPETAIITDKNGVVQETKINRKGYVTFKGEQVHRIQMWSHVGYKPRLHIHHIDQNKLNNSLSNLIYLTLAEHSKIHNPNGIPHEMTEEVKYKCGNAFRGKKFTEEHKNKISESNIGKHNHSEEAKKRISELTKAAMTEEVREKISKSNRGKSAWNKGKKMSEETKNKIRNTLTGRHLSEETKNKIRNTLINKKSSQKIDCFN